MTRLPFIRTPPFPGRRNAPIAVAGMGKADAEMVAAALRRERVGGSFWGSWPTLPDGRDLILAPDDAVQARRFQNEALIRGEADRACLVGPFASRHGIPVISALCDPWQLAAQATRVVAGGDNDLAAVSTLLGTKAEVESGGQWSGADSPAEIVRRLLAGWDFRDPFSGEPADLLRIVEQLGQWRRLIDSNRGLAAVYGVAAWKRVTTNALLWAGADGPRHASGRGRAIQDLAPGERVLAWKSRSPAGLPAALAERGIAVGEIEDGFIRSVGLGANCIPPLSIIVDFTGIYFDPSQPSDLEAILAGADISPALLKRAAALRKRLVAGGIAKYGRATQPVSMRQPGRRRVLVPGQVADDRSILSGGSGATNLDLLRRARELEPDAWVIYKPHPDVEAGHRIGAIPDEMVMRHADEIDRTSSIAPLIDSVDAVHTLTSLAGFEALMRGKAVTTHGTPFYAGWGLTRDLAPVPVRRGRARTLDELVAATLILYPRYLDPVTRLPCPVEILVDRLERDDAKVTSPLVTLRTVQGRVSSMIRAIGGRR